MRAPRSIVVALLVLLVAACGGGGPRTSGPLVVTLTQGSSRLRIEAEVVSNPAARGRGLMGRRSLREGTGMLFVFPVQVRTGFYMKDTLIPLDIAFIADGFVVEVRTMTPCRTSPCPLTTPAVFYDEALEVNAGVFERAGIAAGASVSYDRTLPTAS